MEKITPLLVQKPWAGKFLGEFYKSKSQDIGEAWLLSTIKEGESTVGGRKLSEALGHPLKFVVKIIDAKESLSVQVHPNDEWAMKLENSKGKTECWLILESEPNAGVYLGLKEGVDPKEYEAALKAGEPVEKFMRFFETRRGDFITVPSGTVHAIGGGVTLLEVQQASGITYRLWDWGRPGRELHHEKGLKVSNYEKRFEIRHGVLGGEPQALLKHSDFECYYNETGPNQAGAEGWFIDLKTFEVSRGTQAPANDYIFVR
jgi:mannose-6-phosphate isomerase